MAACLTRSLNQERTQIIYADTVSFGQDVRLHRVLKSRHPIPLQHRSDWAPSRLAAVQKETEFFGNVNVSSRF